MVSVWHCMSHDDFDNDFETRVTNSSAITGWQNKRESRLIRGVGINSRGSGRGRGWSGERLFGCILGFFETILQFGRRFGQKTFLFAFLLFHTAILEPNLHLSLVQLERSRDLHTPRASQVLIEMKLLFKLCQLFCGKIGAHSVWLPTKSILSSFPWRETINRWINECACIILTYVMSVPQSYLHNQCKVLFLLDCSMYQGKNDMWKKRVKLLQPLTCFWRVPFNLHPVKCLPCGHTIW